jgi:SAM-dependent methyltransferase
VLLPPAIPNATYLPVMGDASRRTGCIVAPVRGLGSADAAAPDERVAPSATGVVDGLDVEVGAAYRWASHLTPGLAVLDVGCGSGDGAVLLADAGARSVLGVGSDAEEVQAASQRHGDPARFTVGSPTELGVDSRSFDAVICFGALERAADHEPILAELQRVLAEGGLLMLSLPIGEGRSEDAVNASDAPSAGMMVKRPDVARPSLEQWRSILAARYRNVRLQLRRVGIAAIIAADGLEERGDQPIDDAIWTPGEPESDRAALALASDGELPDPRSLAMLTGLSELHALREKLHGWEERARRAEAEGSAKHWELVAAREGQRRLRKRLHQLEHRPLRVLSRVVRRKPARLGPGPPLRASEHPEDWS